VITKLQQAVDHAGFRTYPPISQEPASLFVRLPVIYEGPEYLDFIAFGTGGVHFGIQKAEAANEPAPGWTYRCLLIRVQGRPARDAGPARSELDSRDPSC
jgi:hypothetical protein